jgi:hypothetical protein
VRALRGQYLAAIEDLPWGICPEVLAYARPTTPIRAVKGRDYLIPAPNRRSSSGFQFALRNVRGRGGGGAPRRASATDASKLTGPRPPGLLFDCPAGRDGAGYRPAMSPTGPPRARCSHDGGNSSWCREAVGRPIVARAGQHCDVVLVSVDEGAPQVEDRLLTGKVSSLAPKLCEMTEPRW